MVDIAVKCPKCGNQQTIHGSPGEQTIITCPHCNLQGRFTFPGGVKAPESYSLEITGLSKSFKDVRAVDNLSLKIRKGEIFGLLGPNGAGKTTTIKSVLGLIHPNSGKVMINGFDIKKDEIEAKRSVGYLPERFSFYENLTPIQTLNFLCELQGVDKSMVKQLIAEVGLQDAVNRKVGTFSKGMTQLLGVAQVMIGNPPIYILDEPMGGLDARWVKIIREKIKKLNEQGATVVFSSHILSEVEAVCDRVAIINKGKLIAQDTVDNLNKYLQIKPRLEIFISGLNGQIPEVLQKFEGVEAVDAKEDRLYVTCDAAIRMLVINALEKAGFKINNIKTIEPSLEDAFVKLVEGDA